MRLLKFAALGSLVVLLSACQSLFKPGLDDPLPTERLASEHLKPGCQGEQCPLVNIDTLKFPDEPQLDPIVERALLEMTRENNETPCRHRWRPTSGSSWTAPSRAGAATCKPRCANNMTVW